MADFDNMYLPGNGFAAGEGFDFTADFDATAPGTVSPSDLMNSGDAYIMSNPASTAFPNLHTPDSSYLESPALASSGLNTSPMDNGLLDSSLNFADLDTMAPLFPPELDQFGHQMPDEKPVSNTSFSSLNSARSSSSNASPMVRQKSSPGRPPAPYPANVPHARKHSESAGISKSKTATRKSLPEIEVNSEDDRETAKRKKNTAAARKSRQRKVEMNEAMEAEINRLRAIVFRLGGNPDED